MPVSALAGPRIKRLISGGTAGNELLTAASGAVLIVLLAVIGVTIIALKPLLSVHLFVGVVHKGSFFVWVAFTSLHVLGHLPAVLRGLRADYVPAVQLAGGTDGRAGRVLVLAGALTAGVVLAILFIPEFSPWLHTHNFHHH